MKKVWGPEIVSETKILTINAGRYKPAVWTWLIWKGILCLMWTYI